ncbi:MAG: UDP-2,3-diacylglucosamine diphosphatase [Candidatus Hydrogenedentes bacterium]|nr:UDP-2,3-diacylglucosamine diphosphatase [Candidatus Hydrogenedentota bacterium]
MKTMIFSDVHLNVAEDGRRKMAEFTTFLRQIDPTVYDRIVILGDLFDFWFEYRQVIFSGYFDVLRAFAALRDRGVEFHFVCGNHDFWAGRFLRDYLDFSIHEASLALDFGGRRALFVHGDGINPDDWSYRLYKKIARFRPVVGTFRLIHPDWAMGIAQCVSRSSRRMFSKHDYSEGSEVKPLQRYAQRVLAQGEADVVFCGHSHYPVIEEFPARTGMGLYINTGDWLFHQTYVVWDGAGFEMLRFGSECAESVEVPSGEAGSQA